MGIRRRILRRAVVSLLCCLVLSGSAIRAAEWEWDLVPYLWAAGVGLDVDINNDPVIEGDASFGNIVDNLEIAGMVRFEGRKGRAGFFVDAVYVSTSDSATTPPHPPELPAGAELDSALKTGRYEGAGFYRFTNETSGLDLFVGVRLIDLDQRVDISANGPAARETSATASDTFVDGFVGARFARLFGKRFWFSLRGDVGAGDTELSWTANAGIGLWFGQTRKYGMELAYEHFEFEVDQPGGLVDVTSKCQMSGPIVVFLFRF